MKKVDSIFTSLSHIMDETVNTNSIMERLNEFLIVVDEKLIPSIEKIQYIKKYDVISRIRNVGRDISLYLYFPEIISKNIIGFYNLNNESFKLLYDNVLRSKFNMKEEPDFKGGRCFFKKIPAFLHGNADYQVIKALNIAEKSVELLEPEYLELLEYSDLKNIDLSALLSGISIPSNNMNSNQVYVTIPECLDRFSKYYTAIFNTVDIMVIDGKECTVEVLEQFCNITKIFVYGIPVEKKKLRISRYCEKHNVTIKYFTSLSEIFSELNKDNYSIKVNNFCHVLYLENILYEILWYLSVRRTELEAPLAEINDNLLYKDDESYKVVKALQKVYSTKINLITELYSDYKSICEELVEQVALLQEAFGVKEDIQCMNQHIKMDEVMIDLLLKMSETYKSFPETDSKAKMRQYCDLYKQISGMYEVSQVILNDFLGNKQVTNDLVEFKILKIESDFFKRKKLDLRKELSLKKNECVEIIFNLNSPFRNVEKRILGEYYLGRSKKQMAKKYLMEALENGDNKAGEIIVNSLTVSEAELEQLADYGVKIAAYKIGKKLYEKHETGRYEKYLHIAASQGHMDAIVLLGDISYNQFDERNSNKLAQEALHYYLIAEKNGSKDSNMNDKMGYLYFYQKDYKKAKEYFESSHNAESDYVLGLIYEHGYGCAQDKNKALNYYKKAVENGHTAAKVELDRINSEIEAKKEKEVVTEKKSYSASSYTSNYSSSSGW